MTHGPHGTAPLFPDSGLRDNAREFAEADPRPDTRDTGETMTNEAASRVVLVGVSDVVVDHVCTAMSLADGVEVIASLTLAQELAPLLLSTGVDVIVIDDDSLVDEVYGIVRDADGAHRPKIALLTSESVAGEHRVDERIHGRVAVRTNPEVMSAALRAVGMGCEVTVTTVDTPPFIDIANVPAVNVLSEREREVLQAMAVRGTARAAAEELALSYHTVRNHLRRVSVKLGVNTSLHAVIVAIREEWIDVSGVRSQPM